jgi:hypothetical protein
VATFGRFFPKKREGIYNRIIYFENIFKKMAKIHPRKIITGPNSFHIFQQELYPNAFSWPLY